MFRLWPRSSRRDVISAEPVAIDEDADDGPKPQLSFPRVTLAIIMVAAVIAGTAMTVRGSLKSSTPAPLGTTWFAPYVDTTLSAQFQDPGVNAARQVALGFIVADPHQGCLPSWGGYYSPDQAASTLNLDRRIAQVRSEGGDVIVSFGGMANSELALTCTNIVQLSDAYRSIISRYKLSTVDFDLEGAALSDSAATERRATALAAVQKALQASGKRLAVWLTLPTAPSGLSADASATVATVLAAGVDLAGVNVMAMDFGSPEADMSAVVRSSLVAVHDQLATLYSRYRVSSTSAATWNRMGVTVMIGQNDTAGEIFTIADAQQLVGDVKTWHLGRVSMWSLNRDVQCGSSFAVVGVQSNTCSGTAQAKLAFSTTFATFTGSASAMAAAQIAAGGPATIGNQTTTVATTPGATDNPATSPYPIWQPTRPYVAGYKVVRQGDVYQSKWFSQGVDPATQVQYAYQTPWQIVGPVLSGDRAPTTTTLPVGTDPVWAPTVSYNAGARVLYNGLPYQAKWYNQAASPGAEEADPSSSPWNPLFTLPGEPTNG